MQSLRGKQKSIRGRNKDTHAQSFSKSNTQGNEAEFFLNDSSRTMGLIKAISPQAEFGVIYSRFKPSDSKEYCDSMSDEAKLISFKDVKKIVIKNVNPLECLKANFTDSDIARQSNKQVEHKELVPFFPNEQNLEDESLDMCNDTFSPQEMYQINKDNFNVMSSYDPELSQYTVPVDKNDPNYPKLEEMCGRLAKEFINDTDEVMYANEDNEEVISAVLRTNSNDGQNNLKQDRKSSNNNGFEKKSQKSNNVSYKNSQKNNLTYMDNSVKSVMKTTSNSPAKSVQQNQEKTDSQNNPTQNDSKTDHSEKTVSNSEKRSEESGSLDKKMVELDLDAPPFEPTYTEPTYQSIPVSYYQNQFYMNNQMNINQSPLVQRVPQINFRMPNYCMMNCGPPPMPSSANAPTGPHRMNCYVPNKHGNNSSTNGGHNNNAGIVSPPINQPGTNAIPSGGMHNVNHQRPIDQMPQSVLPQQQPSIPSQQQMFCPSYLLSMPGSNSHMVFTGLENGLTLQQLQNLSLQSNGQYIAPNPSLNPQAMLHNQMVYPNPPNHRGGPTMLGGIVDHSGVHSVSQASNQRLPMIPVNAACNIGANGAIPSQIHPNLVFNSAAINSSSQPNHLHQIPSNQSVIMTSSYNSQHPDSANQPNFTPNASIMHPQQIMVMPGYPSHNQQPAAPPPQPQQSHPQYNSSQGQPVYQDKR